MLLDAANEVGSGDDVVLPWIIGNSSLEKAFSLDEGSLLEEAELMVVNEVSIEDILKDHPNMAKYFCFGSFLDKPPVSETRVYEEKVSIEDILRENPLMANYLCCGSFLDEPSPTDRPTKEETKVEVVKVMEVEKDAEEPDRTPTEVDTAVLPTKKKTNRLWDLPIWKFVQNTYSEGEDTKDHRDEDPMVQREEVVPTISEIKPDNVPARKPDDAIATVVAQHYNGLQANGFAERNASEIVNLRRFNNYIKGEIMETATKRIRQEKGYGCSINVLDLCCGKGGDLFKWNRERVNHVICADIAEKSIAECKDRYANMNSTRKWFTTEFIVADCTAVSIKHQFKDPNQALDLVSSQFAFHYSFESQSRIEKMLENVTDNLKPGGYFIGTTTDADEIMRRLRKDEDPHNRAFGNSIFSVDFPLDTPLDPPPRFGAKYNFKLKGAVDCPEFLVDFRTFEELAAEQGLKLVRKCRFQDVIAEEKTKGNDLLSIYKLTEEELEVVSMYLFFVFQKEV